MILLPGTRNILPTGVSPVAPALVALTGCSAMTPSSKTQGMSVFALGVPGIAVITSTTQHAEYAGGDTNGVSQANPADVTVPVFIGK